MSNDNPPMGPTFRPDWNIHQRIWAARQILRTVKKVTVPGLNYKSLQHDDVNAAVLEVEEAYHINSYILPLTKHAWQRVTLMVKGQPKEYFFTEIVGIKRYVAIESEPDDEDYIDVGFIAYGIDIDDKGPGKAISMGNKYADSKTYRLATGDNEESRVTSPPAGVAAAAKMMGAEDEFGL